MNKYRRYMTPRQIEEYEFWKWYMDYGTYKDVVLNNDD